MAYSLPNNSVHLLNVKSISHWKWWYTARQKFLWKSVQSIQLSCFKEEYSWIAGEGSRLCADADIHCIIYALPFCSIINALPLHLKLFAAILVNASVSNTNILFHLPQKFCFLFFTLASGKNRFELPENACQYITKWTYCCWWLVLRRSTSVPYFPFNARVGL